MKPTREERVKYIALEVGFSLVGITDVSPHPISNEANGRWLDAGMHGDMAYLLRHRERRRAPSQLLDGARSAICVGLNYYQEIERSQRDADGSEGRGVFSVYAHGRDYHPVMEEILDRLSVRLAGYYPDLRTYACMDTKPISDRTMAIRAGIAWLGKNSSAISPRYGSWIFLGELITNLDLEPDAPLKTLCGKCTKCLDACPTGALDDPFVVDARKCISYLTIEKRGEIPEVLHDNIGLHVYGCDICQSVCPFNNVATKSDVFHSGDRSPIVDLSLEELEQIGDEEFRELTKDSAIKRCKSEGMRRNASIVKRNIEVRGQTPSRREEKP
ncbi:MAG: tRNA epoxyqueuosine(34) reductase QueG [Candidatus Krumholzibacteria bacterium]|nr:tRNA epoxyqueuosine(34) reductase QueG [Candidatus Krumholzibacteria bacterium]